MWMFPQVEALVNGLGAILVDVRMSPVSNKPGFNKANLEDAIPDRYMHMPEFGNASYRAHKITIANPEAGVDRIRDVLTDHDVVLMCGCKYVSTCHRAVVAQILEETFYLRVEHLEGPGRKG